MMCALFLIVAMLWALFMQAALWLVRLSVRRDVDAIQAKHLPFVCGFCQERHVRPGRCVLCERSDQLVSLRRPCTAQLVEDTVRRCELVSGHVGLCRVTIDGEPFHFVRAPRRLRFIDGKGVRVVMEEGDGH